MLFKLAFPFPVLLVPTRELAHRLVPNSPGKHIYMHDPRNTTLAAHHEAWSGVDSILFYIYFHMTSFVSTQVYPYKERNQRMV